LRLITQLVHAASFPQRFLQESKGKLPAKVRAVME
jgi:hypothetical protein